MSNTECVREQITDLVYRNINGIVPETQLLSAIILQALKDKDIKWLRSANAGALFKALGFDNKNFMDMAEPIIDDISLALNKAPEKTRTPNEKWSYLRKNKEMLEKEYYRLQSLRRVADKYEVSVEWLRKEVLGHVVLIPKKDNINTFRLFGKGG